MIHTKQSTLGVIGGLGPIATSHFMELVIRMTEAQRDQEHLDMIIYHTPSIPDRSSYILNPSLPSPLEPMIELGQRLSEQNVGCIAIPCVTAHYFHESLSSSIPAPIIHAVEETAIHLQSAVMELIFGCIKANRPADMPRFHRVARELREAGAEVIILGCTELSLIKRDHDIGSGFLDALEVLAQQSVLRCGAWLKDEYRCLITK